MSSLVMLWLLYLYSCCWFSRVVQSAVRTPIVHNAQCSDLHMTLTMLRPFKSSIACFYRNTIIKKFGLDAVMRISKMQVSLSLFYARVW